MTSLTEVRTIVAQTIQDAIPRLNVYRAAVDAVNGPAVIIAPDNPGADYLQAMRMRSVNWTLKATILVAWNDAVNSQDELDEYIDVTGDFSVPRSLYNARRELPFPVVVSQMLGYGARYNFADTEYVGAVLRLQVHAEGS